MISPTVAAVLIGDVVGSRRFSDRRALQQRVSTALSDVNGTLPSVQPLQMTLGDEFQAAYATLRDAVGATLAVRLRLLPEVDTRFGLGFGSFTVFDADQHPVSQDGPAWWAAREAIERVHALQQRPGRARTTRTWFVDGSGDPAREELAAFVNAELICRDALVAQPDERDVRLLEGWLRGGTQRELAERLGITQPAVSQRLARMGALALRDADQLLTGRPA